jgi:hypothetical protein
MPLKNSLLVYLIWEYDKWTKEKWLSWRLRAKRSRMYRKTLKFKGDLIAYLGKEP